MIWAVYFGVYVGDYIGLQHHGCLGRSEGICWSAVRWEIGTSWLRSLYV